MRCMNHIQTSGKAENCLTRFILESSIEAVCVEDVGRLMHIHVSRVRAWAHRPSKGSTVET